MGRIKKQVASAAAFTRGPWKTMERGLIAKSDESAVVARLTGVEREADEKIILAAPLVASALSIMVFDPTISRFLKERDPMAFAQAAEALQAAGLL